jgi:hypothetical protein
MLQELFDTSGDGPVILSTDLALMMQPAAMRMFGIPEGRFMKLTVADGSRDQFEGPVLGQGDGNGGFHLEKGSPLFEWTHRRSVGRSFPPTSCYRKDYREKRSQVSIRDISAQRRPKWNGWK